ncbi:MAG: tetratricopeptide repeat protein, partial [Cyanobacteria bacterium P01_A01_bin.123]
MQHLHTQLQQSQQVAITAIAGMGGIGKTELALQYARSHWQQHYPGGVCWLEARDQDIATGILGFAQAWLELIPSDELPVKERIAYCWRNWPDFGDSPAAALVVIDDVSDYKAIEDYLPTQARFTLLLTTRAQRLAATVKPFAIEVLSEEAALELLTQLTEDPERIDAELEQAKALCQWLGYLPLALELAGHYLARKPTLSLVDFQVRLKAQELAARALAKAESGMTNAQGVASAFELSWQDLSEDAQTLACVLSLFALAPIPWSRVEACLPNVDSEDLEDRRDYQLCGFSLLQHVEEERYQLHPLIHRFIRTKLADDSPLISAYCGVMVKAAQEMDETPTLAQVAAWREMVPHVAEAAIQWVSRVSNEDLTWPFTGLGRFYQGQGVYAQAEVWRECCVTVTQARLGHEHPDVAKSLNNLALLYSEQGRYGDAEPLFLQAIDLGKASLGDDHPDVATRLNNLAGLYQYQGRYAEAEPLFLQAIDLGKASLGDDHPYVATSLNNLATLYRAQGRYGDAEPLFLQALEMTKTSLGEAHPDVATRLNNLATLYQAQGRYGEAEPLFLQAIDLGKASLGEAHPDVALSLNNLASLYRAQGRYEEAEPLFLQAIDLGKASLGDDHPDVATSLNN